MGREEEIINERKRKIEELAEQNIPAYSYKLEGHEKRAFSIDVQSKYLELKNEEVSKD